jgi:hypothetical protein
MGCSVIQEDSAMLVTRKRSRSAVAETGSCHFKRSAASLTSREAAATGSLSLVSWKGITGSPRLFVKHEHAGLAGKTDFLHLPVFAEEQRIIG